MTTMLDLEKRTDLNVTEVITPDLFGGNLLFRYDYISQQDSNYRVAADELGVSALRYPGGTMTEINFDIKHPDGSPLNVNPKTEYVGISEFLQFAAETQRKVDIVVPTKGMYLGSADPTQDRPRSIDIEFADEVLSFVRKILTKGDTGSGALPDTPISSIEIGNEYWGGGKMTASEYGQIVNFILPKIERIFSETFPQGHQTPNILIQMGSPLDPQFKTGLYSGMTFQQRNYQANYNIISQITDPAAKNSIDGLVQHYYYSTDSLLLDRSTWTMNSLDSCYNYWKNEGYGDKDYAVTEWNVGLGNPNQLGLKAASVLIEQFSYMIEIGVDAAFAWPIQGYANGLSKLNDGHSMLSPIGAAFKLMSEVLVGTTILPYEIQGSTLELETFGSSEKTVFFAASRAMETLSYSIDVSQIVGRHIHAGGIRIGISDGQDVTDPDALAVLTYLNEQEFFRDGKLNFTLKPFEVLRIVFDLPTGRSISGTTLSDKIVGGLGDDTISGLSNGDSLTGGAGDDQVFGGFGKDFIMAGEGNDTLHGGWGSDKIFGGHGADLVFGNRSDDTLYAVSGRDTLYGGMGSDYIFGGVDGAFLDGGLGSDVLIGMGGDDTLTGGPGLDTLVGGSGRDTFVFQLNDTSADLITDFQSGLDVIALDHNIFPSQSLGPVGSESFVDSGDLKVTGLPILVFDYDVGILYFDGDRSGKITSGEAILRLAPMTALSFTDIILF